LHRREPYPGASALSHPGARALNRVPAASEITRSLAAMVDITPEDPSS
jgi:hypothetical protein